jgi:hypothetical protein
MPVKQISVFVENKPGRLESVIGVLSENQIDIRALSLADTMDFGILRLIVDQPDEASRRLKDAGFAVKQTDVVAIAISDRPGGLHEALTLLSGEGVGIEYLYAFVGTAGFDPHGKALTVLRTDDNEKAVEILSSNGIDILDAQDIERI